MIQIKRILIGGIASLLMLSSCNYLNVDKYFVDTFIPDSLFVNKINLQRYMWNIASNFPDEGGIWGENVTPGVLASDEAFVQWNHQEFLGVKYILGEITPDNLLGFAGQWTNMYKIIRKCNTLLANKDKCTDLTTLDEMEVLGYTYFMRAYAYYNILVDFGPVILLGDDVLETNEEPIYYDTKRATFDESVDYICSELEKAAKYLPLNVTVTQFGRPTKGAAYGLVARLRLMQASPSFNGGESAKRYFSTWLRKEDNVPYVSQKYDEKRWAVAAHATKRVMDMGIYSLHTVVKGETTPKLPSNVSNANFPNGAGDIDPYKSYKDMFSGEAIAFKNPEFVWGRNSAQVTDYTKHSFSVTKLGGWNGLSVPQKIVDAFYMEDGRDIKNSSKEYPYLYKGKTSSPKSFSGYQLAANISNMYANREMRFYANIGFSGRIWPCLSTSESSYRNQQITYAYDGNSGKTQTDGNLNNYPITGYVTTKYIHNDDAWKGNNAERLTKAFGIIRYAEILLSYVEALNNLTKTHTIQEDDKTYSYQRDILEMKKAFNQVRYRAGLPGLTDKELSSQKEMFDIIVRERMIEFFHENRRYYDVRRWGIYEEEDKKPIEGMNTEAKEDEGYYDRVVVVHKFARNRIVDKKMVFLPISRQEIRKVPQLDQNPGWD